MIAEYNARYYATNLAGNLTEMCGSDSYLPLDGRLCVENMHIQTQQKAMRMRKVKQIEAYRLFFGDKPITPIHTFSNQNTN